MALGRDPEINEWSALARVITALRPDWRWADVRAALLADDRAYAAIARSAILGASDHDVRHPNGLRYVNPRGDGPTEAERHPSAVQLGTWRDAPRCPHGAASGTCALCRNGIDPTTGDVA